MQTVRADFDTRSQEIDDYLSFVKAIVSVNSPLNYLADTGKPSTYRVSEDLRKILKANCYLLIYNLVESTMTNAFEAIFDHLKAENVSFDDLSRNLRIIVLGNARVPNPRNLQPELIKIAEDIIHKTFNRRDLFSGNITSDLIKITLTEYGVKRKPGSVRFKAKGLATVKGKRNDLAHGAISFAACGQDAIVSELVDLKTEAAKYLQNVLDDIEYFLNSKNYLHTP